MVTGLEVVLSTGEVCRIGSCSMGPYWFSKGPTLPDLSGLFLGWPGTTGIITKWGIRLYPRKKMRDVEILVTDRDGLVPDVIYRITYTEMTEDITVRFQPRPLMFKDNNHVTIYFTADTDEKLEFKKLMIWDALKELIESKDGGFMSVEAMKSTFLEMPQRSIAAFADVPKGEGFEYSGPITLVDEYPFCAQKVKELAFKYDVVYSGTARIISGGHAMMFGISFAFNRADYEMTERVRRAIHEGIEFALKRGAIPWKPNVHEQGLAMSKMDPNTLKLMQSIKNILDPNGIMNPGNCEVGS